jgi:hypothetical protein
MDDLDGAASAAGKTARMPAGMNSTTRARGTDSSGVPRETHATGDTAVSIPRDWLRGDRDPYPPRISVSYPRLAYCAMLLELSRDVTLDFWNSHRIERNGELMSLRQTLEYLWDENNCMDLSHAIRTLNDIEPFLLRRQLAPARYFKTLHAKLSKGVTVSPRLALALLTPFVELVYKHHDVRRLYLENLQTLNQRIRPGTIHRLVSHHTVNGAHEAITMLILDTRFDRSFPALDVDLLYLPRFRQVPTRIGAPAFERIRVLSQCRTLEQALCTGLAAPRAAAPDPRCLAERMPFSRFCERHGLHLDTRTIPDPEVSVALRNYVCPVRKRTVVTAGCAYGAPVYLSGIHYRGRASRPDNPLQEVIEEALQTRATPWNRAAGAHRAMMESLKSELHFVFDASAGALLVNGKRFARGIPGLIMRKMITRYLETGCELFEHRDFTYDPELSPDTANQNFGVRLKRLEQAIARKLPDISFDKPRPGAFRIRFEAAVTFRER